MVLSTFSLHLRSSRLSSFSSSFFSPFPPPLLLLLLFFFFFSFYVFSFSPPPTFLHFHFLRASFPVSNVGSHVSFSYFIFVCDALFLNNANFIFSESDWKDMNERSELICGHVVYAARINAVCFKPVCLSFSHAAFPSL